MKKGNGTNVLGDFNISTNLGVSAEFNTGPLEHKTTLQADSYFDQSNALDAALGVTLVTPTYLLTHEVTLPINDENRFSLMAGLGVRNLGTETYLQYQATAGFESDSFGTRIKVGSNGAISDDLPIWMPGSERMATLSIGQDIIPNGLWLNLDGQQSFENAGEYQLVGGLGARY